MKHVGKIAGKTGVWMVVGCRLVYYDDNDDLLRIDAETEREVWATDPPDMEVLQRVREATIQDRIVGMTGWIRGAIRATDYGSDIGAWLDSQPKFREDFVRRVAQMSLVADGLPRDTPFEIVKKKGSDHDN